MDIEFPHMPCFIAAVVNSSQLDIFPINLGNVCTGNTNLFSNLCSPLLEQSHAGLLFKKTHTIKLFLQIPFSVIYLLLVNL